jgi:SPP1 gp7 family putative phage head morphogenesis protein
VTTEDYWADVALKRLLAIEDGQTVTRQQVLRLYDEARNDIEGEIRAIKRNYRARYGLDEQTAEAHLERAVKEGNFKRLVQAMQNAPDELTRQHLLDYVRQDGLSVRAYGGRIERYRDVQEAIRLRMAEVAQRSVPLIRSMAEMAYKEAYYGNIADYARGMNIGLNFAMLDDRDIAAAIETPWAGARFSERVWADVEKVAEKAQNLVARALISGEDIAKTSRKLQDVMLSGKYEATRLVRTETMHARAMGDMAAYKDLGLEKYRYLATLDYVTCDICGGLDNRIFDMDEAKEGVNYPVMHPNCRCTTTIDTKMPNRRARNPETDKNYIVDGSMTYDEWLKSLTPEQQKAFEIAQKSRADRIEDKLQWEKYRKALGTKEVPRRFADFQQMKYGEPERWKELKVIYRGRLNEQRKKEK